jgi:hypothetical protein
MIPPALVNGHGNEGHHERRRRICNILFSNIVLLSPSVLFPSVQSRLCVLRPFFRVCTVVHRLPADSPALLSLTRFTARYTPPDQ